MNQKSRIRAVMAGLMAAMTVGSAMAGPPVVVADAGRVVELDVEAVRRAPSGMSFAVEGVEVPGWGRVDVEFERFRVMSERTKFVAGTGEGDREIEFDPESVVLLRGSVAGLAGSHAVVAITSMGVTGRLELGPGRPQVALASAPGGMDRVGVERVTMRPMPVGAGAGPLTCSLAGRSDGEAADGPAGAPPSMPEPIRGMTQLPLAVDADHEYFLLMGDEQAALEYITMVYGFASDIMMRDIFVRIDLVWVRVWMEPDPYGPTAGWPLVNPREVGATQAQFFGAERQHSSGGVAFLCGDRSLVSHILGFTGDPLAPNVYNRDMKVIAHELGHTLGSRHTHDYGLDACHLAGNPRRGTIMSYCFYHNGGIANVDHGFHMVPRQRIALCMFGAIADCNQNGVPDHQDIASGFSADVNGNGIPDECEDCNGNGIIDEYDIASGFSLDLNGNGIPDECEPDCNGNGIPDEMDIRLGTSLDENGNGIPDECEADLDGDGRSDYLQIQDDMSLDVNRNAMLDAYEDCDGDGVPDLVALDSAWSGWVADGLDGALREYHPVTGVLMRESAPGLVEKPQDVLITADRRILVSDAATDRIVEFNARAEMVGDLVAPGAGGLEDPGAMLVRGGELLVASAGTDSVLRFDLETGAPLGVLVPSGSGGLVRPYGMTFGPRGDLYVTSADDQVMEYSAGGAFRRIFVSQADNGGLRSPRDILFTPAIDPPAPTPPAPARFLIASEFTKEILEFDPDTGAFRHVFNIGTQDGKLDRPWGMVMGRDGEIYLSSRESLESAGIPGGGSGGPAASHLTDPKIFQYQTRTGLLLRPYIQRPDSRLPDPVGFAFMPGDDIDCNFNQLPDHCDIASGFSEDRNGNGVPDECEICHADCDGSGALDFFDYLCFQSAFMAGELSADCDGSGILDFFDFLCFQNAYAAGCP